MPSGLDGNPEPIVTPARSDVLGRVAAYITARKLNGQVLLVAVDGIDGSGKSTFADELAAVLERNGANPIRSTIDSFHNPRSVRWRRGKTSPVGFYLDSHNLDALQTSLLDPLRVGVGAHYRTACFDEPSDQPVAVPERTVDGTEVLVFDGLFLSRPELRDRWDYTIFLEGQQRVNLGRLAHVLADAPDGGPALIDHVLRWVERIERYSSGMRLYLDTDDPMGAADLVIDNNDLANPSIVARR